MNHLTVIYAKNPVAGKVKTRIARHSNRHFACNAYRALLRATLAQLALDSHAVVAYSPNLRHGHLKSQAKRHALNTQAQPHGDLGQRMRQTLRQGLKNHDAVVLVGTDCPQISQPAVALALKALETHDAYVQPASDGGYVLIASKCYCPALFQQIDWSTRQVLAQTKRQARTAKISLSIGPTLPDVDTKNEWRNARRLKHTTPLWRKSLR